MIDFSTRPLVETAWLAAHLAGYHNVALYDASWEEWGTDPTFPLE